MNDTTNVSPVSDAFGEHPLHDTSEAKLPPETKAAVEKAKAKAKPAPKAKAAPKAKPAPKAKAKAKAKAAPKAPKSLVRRVGGDNKILFTFRVADTMLEDITALATMHSMTPAALIRGALNAFLEQNGPKRGRAK